MKLYNLITLPTWILLFGACADNSHFIGKSSRNKPDSSIEESEKLTAHPLKLQHISTGKTNPQQLLAYARSLNGIRYKYGSIDPNQGFDCSGFITYVFNHFGISVPRSSRDFTNVEQKVSLRNSKPGDLILFTGTDSTVRDVGHMGIITENDGRDIHFIHSTSGKAYGVTITPLNKYYQGRFVKAIRIFNATDTH